MNLIDKIFSKRKLIKEEQLAREKEEQRLNNARYMFENRKIESERAKNNLFGV